MEGREVGLLSQGGKSSHLQQGKFSTTPRVVTSKETDASRALYKESTSVTPQNLEEVILADG